MMSRRNLYEDLSRQNTQRGSDAFNDMTLKRGGIITPPWTKGYLTVRIMPGVRPEDRSFPDTFRMEGGVDFGYWLDSIYHVRNLCSTDARTQKDKFYSFVVTDTLYDSNPADSPYAQVCNAISKIAKNPNSSAPAGWVSSRMGGVGKGARWPDWAKKYIMPVRVYHSGETDWQEDTALKSVYVLMISKGLGELIIRSLQRNMANATNPDQVIDMTNPNGGAFLTIWSSNVGDPRYTKNYTLLEGTTSRTDAQGNTFNGYYFSVDSMYPCNDGWKGSSPVITPEQLAQYGAITDTWQELLRFMTYKEQAYLLSQIMPADLIQYAFSGIPEWLPMSDTAMPQLPTYGASPSYAASVPQTRYTAPPVASSITQPIQQPIQQPVSQSVPQATSITQPAQISEDDMLKYIRQRFPQAFDTMTQSTKEATVPAPLSAQPVQTTSITHLPPVTPFGSTIPDVPLGTSPMVEFCDGDTEDIF